MKQLKMLTLLSVAAMALLALAGTASATTLTSPVGTVYTGTLNSESEGHIVLDNPIAKIECASSLHGNSLTHGAGVTAQGNIGSLSINSCTNSWHVTVVSAGSLEVHAAGEGKGTVTSTGATVEATRFGITCRYATSATDLGTSNSGKTATVNVNAAIPFHSGSGLCGSSATTLTGSYKITTPASLTVDS